MRGQQKLFNSIFLEEIKTPKETVRPRNFYMPERNEALYKRYYYYVEIKRYRYDDCISQLEKEFFLTSFQITKLLMKMAEDIREFSSSSPSTKQLRQQYPWLSW